MKQLAKISDVFGSIILIGLAGLMLYLFLLGVRPTGTLNFGSSVDVADVAQSIQTRNREIELTTALQTQRANSEMEIAKKQQTLTLLESEAKEQLAERQARLLTIQTQIGQTEVDLQAMQMEITQLQRAIQTDETELSTLMSILDQLNRDLTATQAQLQAAQTSLAEKQVITTPPPSPETSPNDDNKSQSSGKDDSKTNRTDQDHYESDEDESHD